MHKAFKQIIVLDPYYSRDIPEDVKKDVSELANDYGGISNGSLVKYYPLEDQENENNYPHLNSFCIENSFANEIHIWIRW